MVLTNGTTAPDNFHQSQTHQRNVVHWCQPTSWDGCYAAISKKCGVREAQIYILRPCPEMYCTFITEHNVAMGCQGWESMQ
jgi:hypothetical protein